MSIGAAPGDYAGSRYLLARADHRFEIWDRESPDKPVDSFSDDDDGWQKAWIRFTMLEPSPVPVQAIPQHEPPLRVDTFNFHGEFKKLRIPPLTTFGKFREQLQGGFLGIGPDGLRVAGRHVLSVRTRSLIGIGLAVCLIALFFLSRRVVLPGVMVSVAAIYLLFEQILLKRSDLTVPWNNVRSYVVDFSHRAIAIDLDLPSHLTPVVFQGEGWEGVLDALRQFQPTLEIVGRPTRLISIWIWVTLGILAAIVLLLVLFPVNP